MARIALQNISKVFGSDVIAVNEASEEQLKFVSEIDRFEVENVDAILPQPFERTAVNGFGFLQIVRPRRHASLFELAADRAAFEDLRRLDTRLNRVHHVRGWVFVTVVLTIIALAAFLPRAAGLGGAAAVTASLLLSWAGATRFGPVIAAMAVLTIVLAVAGSLRRSLVPAVVAVFLAAFTIVLAVDPELNSLAVLGARPDGGGRFYGVGNQVETLLLPAVLVAQRSPVVALPNFAVLVRLRISNRISPTCPPPKGASSTM